MDTLKEYMQNVGEKEEARDRVRYREIICCAET